MLETDTLRLELNIGSLCNFRCRYCFEAENYKPTKVSREDIVRFAKYAHFLKFKKYPDYKFRIAIFGGEPLMQIDTLEAFIRSVSNAAYMITFTTNGALVEKYKDRLLRLRNICRGCILKVCVSYDFCNQNETRQAGSYDTVRDAIRWLYHNKMLAKTNTVFSMKNFHSMDDVFFDYVDLANELPGLRCSFNIDRWGDIPVDMDYTPIRKSLKTMRDYMDSHPDIRFFYNNNVGTDRGKTRLKDCFYGNILVSFCDDGYIYPGYDTPYESKEIADMLRIGHVSEDFEELERKRLTLVSRIPSNIPDDCMKCHVPCRVFPWRVMNKADMSQWNNKPSDGLCKITRVVGEYLS